MSGCQIAQEFRTGKPRKSARNAGRQAHRYFRIVVPLCVVSHYKQLTFLGEMINKTDEGKNQRLAYRKYVTEVIIVIWSFN
jgi:hypothetical protein